MAYHKEKKSTSLTFKYKAPLIYGKEIAYLMTKICTRLRPISVTSPLAPNSFASYVTERNPNILGAQIRRQPHLWPTYALLITILRASHPRFFVNIVVPRGDTMEKYDDQAFRRRRRSMKLSHRPNKILQSGHTTGQCPLYHQLQEKHRG